MTNLGSEWVSNEQFGFVKSRSTIDALDKLLTIVENDQKLRRNTLSLFFYIKGDFDNKWHPGILYKWVEKGYDLSLIKVPDMTLMFMNIRVETKEKVRYLGVILDRKMSWSEHVTTRVNAAKQYSLRLMSAAKTTWSLKPLALRKLYKDVIESTILYAVPVWVVAAKKKFIQNARRSVHGISMIVIS
ncbi:hypothetical protein QYM36_003236 [Artemia franciscana]|uniref:Endonuclease-reverse transcriptase n=1 Tax=Artemia franciscana TaxID=6661 RepID=A0AA88ILI4_ARTSF|nr:hypothetical protein QYM36_003236 [Artemia franciscana]